MIFDTIENLSKYESVLPGLATAVQILKTVDLAAKEKGSYTSDDPLCRYNIAEYTTVGDKQFEIHKKEVDVQIMLTGCEKMTLASRSLCEKAGTYDAEGDASMVDGDDTASITVCPGTFAIFFTGEPHKPGLTPAGCCCSAGDGKAVKKVIFKIKVDA